MQAMESHVVTVGLIVNGGERVWLYEEVTLDIRSLMDYSGQGKCREVRSYWDT